jgi:uncharacterized repeat protein (TIGR03943 family)
MTVKPRLTNPKRRSIQHKSLYWLQSLLDILAIGAWGLLLVQYWLTDKINILLHPDYVWLAYSAGFFLLGLATIRLLQLVLSQLRQRKDRSRQDRSRTIVSPQHFALLPPGTGSAILLVVALLGWQFTPQPFASDVALNRGVTDSLTLTRSQPQAFRAATSPEERSLVEWIRTLNVYPEPDAYTGQKANVEGFVIHSSEVPDNYLVISRFVITCCAADVYPVGLPVQLPTGDRSAYPPDTWLRVEGEMNTETLNNKRQLVIQAKSLTNIPAPATPYDY